jgi:hypothetical protein
MGDQERVRWLQREPCCGTVRTDAHTARLASSSSAADAGFDIVGSDVGAEGPDFG